MSSAQLMSEGRAREIPASRERPILFSGPMVRAILAGRQTHTRRVIAFPPRGAFVLVEMKDGSLWPYASDDAESSLCSDGCEHPMACSYGAPGDSLWVRETWQPFFVGGAIYLADAGTPRLNARTAADAKKKWPGWKPSIHMPRWASRLTLRITDVRVERLQEITEEDARAEGLTAWRDPPRMPETHYGIEHADVWEIDPRKAFGRLWDTINAKRAPWASNPWVWVVSFGEVRHGSR